MENSDFCALTDRTAEKPNFQIETLRNVYAVHIHTAYLTSKTNLNPSHFLVASLFCCHPLVGEFEVFLREATQSLDTVAASAWAAMGCL